MVFFINDEKRLIPVEVSNEEDYINKENFLVTDNLPQALYPFYKLDENGNIIPDEELILEKAKDLKIEEIKKAFNFHIKNGYKCSNGITMDCDFLDIQKLKAGIELAETLGMSTMLVGDYYNQDHELELAEVKKMLTELGINYSTLWSKKVSLRKAIYNATSIKEVINISWN